jgi:alkylation response protein AidB-like acyl-CoA dehydrogenase
MPRARTASVPFPPALSSDVHDVLAPGGGAGGGAAGLLDAARQVAEEVLTPAAEATDQAPVVPASHLEALAGAGLMGLYRPPAAPAAVVREVYEVLAGACGVTFFVWVQHHAPVRMLAASANDGLRARYLEDLCAGRLLGGVAFAYLRRPGPPAVVATPVEGGYRVDGEAPWVTSWGLAGVYAVAARMGQHVVFFLVEADTSATPPGGCLHDRRPAPAYRASPPLALAAMNASSTVRLAFDGLFVPEDDVLSVVPFEQWQADDRLATAKPNPAAFGIAATCVRLLGDTPLAAELGECRRRSYALADAAEPDIDALLQARAQSLELSVRAATALVVATGGRAMSADHPAQRLLREAAFFTIQAQTPALRRATLAQLAQLERS